MRLLIIEDNPDIVANLFGFFEPKGYVLDHAGNGYSGLGLIAENEYDLVILDVMLPGLSGLEICRKIRTELHSDVPILMLTARDTVPDKVAGFDSGADDYLVKPFSLIELHVRIKALARRASGGQRSGAILRAGELTFDTDTYKVTRANVPVVLTKTGYKLLKCLMRVSPKVVSRETLEQEVWGADRPDSDALRTHIHALRQALDKPFPFPMLRTVSGIGFKLVSTDESA
jgi:DNA-binding response OmpR family regulator